MKPTDCSSKDSEEKSRALFPTSRTESQYLDRLCSSPLRYQLKYTRYVICILGHKIFPIATDSCFLKVASIALLPNFSFISTISEADANTHKHVPQHSLIAPLVDIFPMTLAAIRSEMELHGGETKIMCFLPTARATGLAAALFKRLNLVITHHVSVPEMNLLIRYPDNSQWMFLRFTRENLKVRGMPPQKPSRLSSAVSCFLPMLLPEEWISQESRPCYKSVYQQMPNNTFIGASYFFVQPLRVMHLTTHRTMNRLGRTARAGAAGSGVIILAPFEDFFLRKREISALPLAPHPAAQAGLSLGSPALVQARSDVAGGA